MTKRLGTSAERRSTVLARAVGAVTTVLALLMAAGLSTAGVALWITAPMALALGWWAYHWLMGPVRRRRDILGQSFPPEWESILRKEVLFYRALDPDEQARFRHELQVFLGEKRIVGIKTSVDTTTRE